MVSRQLPRANEKRIWLEIWSQSAVKPAEVWILTMTVQFHLNWIMVTNILSLKKQDQN